MFQVFPFINKSYWNEIRYLGIVDQVYNHMRDMARDAGWGICYFPKDLLSRYGLLREQFLDGSYIKQPEYRSLMHYWLDVYLPNLKQRTRRLLVAQDLDPSWSVLLESTLKRHSRIDSLLVRSRSEG